MESDGGHFDYAATISPRQARLSDACRSVVRQSTGPDYAAENRAALTALKAHYSALGLSLYVYVAPTAVCDGQIEQVRAAYTGVSDNVPAALPDRYFPNEVGHHAHVNAEGVIAASALFADFLVSLGLNAAKENLGR